MPGPLPGPGFIPAEKFQADKQSYIAPHWPIFPIFADVRLWHKADIVQANVLYGQKADIIRLISTNFLKPANNQ